MMMMVIVVIVIMMIMEEFLYQTTRILHDQSFFSFFSFSGEDQGLRTEDWGMRTASDLRELRIPWLTSWSSKILSFHASRLSKKKLNCWISVFWEDFCIFLDSWPYLWNEKSFPKGAKDKVGDRRAPIYKLGPIFNPDLYIFVLVFVFVIVSEIMTHNGMLNPETVAWLLSHLSTNHCSPIARGRPWIWIHNCATIFFHRDNFW